MSLATGLLLTLALPLQDPGIGTILEPAPGVMRAVSYEAWLDSPGGRLAFGLELASEEGSWQAWLRNGPERIEVPEVLYDRDAGVLTLAMPHYDATVEATVHEAGRRLEGRWRKRRGLDRWGELPFHATVVDSIGPAAVAPLAQLAPRWRIDFSSSEDDAVGLFTLNPDGSVHGTILTTLGDYRYLAGGIVGSRLRLSCFDGAHAFLFDAQLQDDGTLAGRFWSGDSWEESWTAVADPDVALPDSFAQVPLAPGIDPAEPLPLAGLRFPDETGAMRDLGDPAFRGKVTVISLFGSWCPNCNDEAVLWAELDELYHDRGLRIVGLAFELTGERERDIQQLGRFRARFDLEHPLLLAGTADKKKAREAFPLLAQVKSYPTAIFLDHTGRVRAIHSGFSGPATGAAHERLRAGYLDLIETLLAEAEAAEEATSSDSSEAADQTE
jgi:thiol-disulfide isomerase/thioredoxin